MSFQKFKSDSYCVGGRHRSATVKIYGDITNKGSKVLIGFCSKWQRKKSITVSDNTIEAEGLSDFFKNLGRKGLNVSKKMAKNVLSNPGRALDLTAKIATAAASKNSKQALSTLPELITFYNTGKGILSWKICIKTHIRVQYFYHTHIYVIIFSIHTCI